MKKTQKPDTPTSEEALAPDPNTSITLIDLQNVIHIIDTVSKRGAFEGPELASVGALRTKIFNFLQAAKPEVEAGASEQKEEAKDE